VIVFSHGLGASREQYGYFGRHMAECGYIVIAPTHAGSDTTALKDWVKKHGGIAGGAGEEGWLKSSVDDPANLRNRPRDVSFIIDQLSVNPLLKSEADAEHVGVAGHSFGADTAMQIGGMTTNLPEEKAKSFRDPRVKAVLPMSPEGPGVMGIEEGSWANFAAPVLFLTGTRDYGQGERSATWRRAGFEHVAGVDSYLVILNGAGHMTFGRGPGETAAAPKPVEDSGKDTGGGLRERLRERVKDRVRERTNEKTGGPDADQARHTAMIESLSAAFFDAYVRGDASAKAWLKAFAAARHDDCTAESKAGTDKE
jgi:predicted dienelactone hydrolase